MVKTALYLAEGERQLIILTLKKTRNMFTMTCQRYQMKKHFYGNDNYSVIKNTACFPVPQRTDTFNQFKRQINS